MASVVTIVFCIYLQRQSGLDLRCLFYRYQPKFIVTFRKYTNGGRLAICHTVSTLSQRAKTFFLLSIYFAADLAGEPPID